MLNNTGSAQSGQHTHCMPAWTLCCLSSYTLLSMLCMFAASGEAACSMQQSSNMLHC